MIRVGIGYDAHPLVKGRKMVLGGIEIAHNLGLSGYSDADVLTHAVIDALLGAAALGDIGTHFPPDDLRYRGVSSLELLVSVRKLLANYGFKIVNLDATIIAREPKLNKYAPEMCKRICQVLGMDHNCVNVKSKTGNELGFVGRGEGVSAMAVALIEKQ